MKKETNKLENSKVTIKFDEREKDITGRDKEDQNNLPCFYTIRKRGLKKAWDILVEKFTEETTMYDASGILNDEKILVHHYCAMD